MIKAILIDDERLAREGVKNLLTAHANKIDLVGEADNGKKGIALIESLRPDLLFLDIQMPDMTGLEMLNHLTYQPRIIFTTAYQKYAVEAFEKMSIDYLVKPISQERFDQAISKFDKLSSSVDEKSLEALKNLLVEKPDSIQRTSLPIKKDGSIKLVDFEDIAFLNADEKYVSVVEANGKVHLVDKSLTSLSVNLPNYFIRVHRSYVVNKNYIDSIQKYFKGTLVLTLKDKGRTSVKTGVTYSKEVKRILGI